MRLYGEAGGGGKAGERALAVAQRGLGLYTGGMTRVTAQEAREDLLELLKAVEQGETVVLEHSGRAFQLSLVPPQTGPAIGPVLVVDDPEVLTGEWTWAAGEDGQLRFEPRASS